MKIASYKFTVLKILMFITPSRSYFLYLIGTKAGLAEVNNFEIYDE